MTADEASTAEAPGPSRGLRMAALACLVVGFVVVASAVGMSATDAPRSGGGGRAGARGAGGDASLDLATLIDDANTPSRRPRRTAGGGNDSSSEEPADTTRGASPRRPPSASPAPPQPPPATPAPRGGKGASPRYVLISFVTSDKNSVGTMYGAMSRLCYAAMHGYEAVLYRDGDLNGWVAPSPRGGKADDTLGKYFSKLFLVNRTFHERRLTERDWVFWMDADTIITEPRITLQDLIRNATMSDLPEIRRLEASGRAPPEPDIVIANTHDGINNGIYGARNTAWTQRFFWSWWDDQYATDHAVDNGPFMHAVLRANAEGKGIEYKAECDNRKNPSIRGWGPFFGCFQHYLKNVICRGVMVPCMSRIPHNGLPLDAAWQPSAREGQQFQWGSTTAYDAHVGQYTRMNSGFGWQPTAEWSELTWLLHLAGSDKNFRDQKLHEFGHRFGSRFSPRCF
jgi:hypothetical protein